MIIKTAPPHAYVGKLVAHLQRSDDGNEEIRFLGARGVVASDDLRDALSEMKAVSLGSKCQKPLYHVAFSPAPGDQLSAADWEHCLAQWEREMGLVDHQRAVVQHFKDGRWHTHAVWNRVDADTGRAASVGRDHFSAKRIARQLERELGLQVVSNDRPVQRQEQGTPLAWEAEQARRTKTNPHEARDLIRAAWEQSDNGRSFQNALEAHGLALAQGDRRAFLVVDDAGNFYALGGRVLPGERVASIRAKLGDLDAKALPTVEQVREGLQAPEIAPETRQDGRGGAGEGSGAGQPPALVPDGAGGPPTAASKAVPEPTPYRDAHRHLNDQAAAIETAVSLQFNQLAKAHERERRLLAEKQRERWWHKVVAKSEKQLKAERELRETMARQQTAEAQALEKKRQDQLAAIDRQRAELRTVEKAEKKAAAPHQAFKQIDRNSAKKDPGGSQELLEQRARKLAELKEREAERDRARRLQKGLGRSLGD